MGESILAVFAHPDDESFLAGGTLAACAVAGHEVILLCATRGEHGPIASNCGASRESLGAVREAELYAAAAELGIRTVECLSYPDGELESVDSNEITEIISRRLRHWRPGAVITFGPEGWYWHPDHIMVHRCVMAASATLKEEGLELAVNYATWPQELAAQLMAAAAARGLPGSLWGIPADAFGVSRRSITTTLDVRRFVGAKLRALRCHRSQIGPDHVLRALPDEIAIRLLGQEHFLLAAGSPSIRDLLPDIIAVPVRRNGDPAGARPPVPNKPQGLAP